jgi:hypothetical protein
MVLDHTIPSRLDAGWLWTLLKLGFEKSAASPIWPQHIEELRCEALREGAHVYATYKIAPGLSMAGQYQIVEYEEGRSLRYRTGLHHPLVGGGTVKVNEARDGSVLRWHVRYQVPMRPSAWMAASYIRLVFERRFFASLSRNLQRYERNMGLQS